MVKKQDEDLPIAPSLPDENSGMEENFESAIAKAVNALTNTNKDYLEMLSKISERDVPRLCLMLSIAGDKDAELDDDNDQLGDKDNFLKAFVYHELKLENSVPAKQGGVRSEQLIRVSKRPDLDNGTGFLSAVRNRFR